MNKIMLMLCTLTASLFCMGMSFAPTDAGSDDFSYNHVSVGSSVEQMHEHFGAERYTESGYAWGTRLVYYVYKNENKIGVDADTNKVVDMRIVDDTYNHGTVLKMGTTSYKIEKTYGSAPRQIVEGSICYAYKNDSGTRLLLVIDPEERSLTAMRITSLPVELPEDNTAYVPDDATSEEENPMIADKQIDTSQVDGNRGGFRINYNYSITR